MMLQVMAYAIGVAAALAVVGHCGEHLAGLYRMPKRMPWVAAMVLSVLLPSAMVLDARMPVVPAVVMAPADHDLAVMPQWRLSSLRTSPAIPTIAAQEPIWKLAVPTDSQIITMWAVASAGFSLYLFAASLLLHRRAARWQRVPLLGHEVLVSEITGPALLGIFQPRIVVPRWLMQRANTTQALILEHERQHMQAWDPLLLVAGLFVIVAVPWNPFLWWQWRRMRHAIEVDCDARVLRTGAAADTYAEVLLEVTRRATRTPPGALAMSEPVAALERRIDSLVPGVARHVGLQTMAVLALATLSAGMALALNAPAIPGRVTASAAVQSPVDIVAKPSVQAPALIADAAGASGVTPESTPKMQSSRHTGSGEASMKKSRTMAVTVAAVSAVTIAQAQVASPPVQPTTPQQVTVQQVTTPPTAAAAIPHRPTAQDVIATDDLNHDGIVTLEEATKVHKNLFFMWSVFDLNGDGKVDVAEVQRAMNDIALGTALTKITGSAEGHLHGFKPETIIASNDQNGDGIVTKEEARIAGKALFDMWDSYDLNKDGKVDAAEIAKASGY